MAKRYRGVKIVPVKVIRYEVRTVDNRKLKSFISRTAATSWVDGYLKAYDQLTPKVAAPPAKPVEVDMVREALEPSRLPKPKRVRKPKAEAAA